MRYGSEGSVGMVYLAPSEVVGLGGASSAGEVGAEISREQRAACRVGCALFMLTGATEGGGYKVGYGCTYPGLPECKTPDEASSSFELAAERCLRFAFNG